MPIRVVPALQIEGDAIQYNVGDRTHGMARRDHLRSQ
jgi:hypothetical protein